jgi:hypothetical protein
MYTRPARCAGAFAFFVWMLILVASLGAQPEYEEFSEGRLSEEMSMPFESGPEAFPRLDAEACIRLDYSWHGSGLRPDTGEGCFSRSFTARLLGNLTPRFGIGVLADAHSAAYGAGEQTVTLQSFYGAGDFFAELIYETGPARLSGSLNWQPSFGLECQGRVVYGAARGGQERDVSFEGRAVLSLNELFGFQSLTIEYSPVENSAHPNPSSKAPWEFFAEGSAAFSGEGTAFSGALFGKGGSPLLSSLRYGYRARDERAEDTYSDRLARGESERNVPSVARGAETCLEASGELFPGWFWKYTRGAGRGAGFRSQGEAFADPDPGIFAGESGRDDLPYEGDCKQNNLSLSAQIFEDAPFLSRALSLAAYFDRAWAASGASARAARDETALSLSCTLVKATPPSMHTAGPEGEGRREVALWYTYSAENFFGNAADRKRRNLCGRYQYSWDGGAQVSFSWELASSDGVYLWEQSSILACSFPLSPRRTGWVYRGEFSCLLSASADAGNTLAPYLSSRHSVEGSLGGLWTLSVTLDVMGYGFKEPFTAFNLSLAHYL